MAVFDWERVQGRNEHNGMVWDDVYITGKGDCHGLVTGDWIAVPVAQLDEFIAFVSGIRDELDPAPRADAGSEGGEG